MKRLSHTTTLAFLLLFLALPSLRAIFKYLPSPEYWSFVYIIACALFLHLLTKFSLSLEWLRKTLEGKALLFILISIFSISTYMIYPIADARKEFGMGSTGDDAIIVPALTLLTDEKLYDPTLYDGAPISPGPGWILQNSPLVFLDAFWLLTTFYIALSAIFFRVLLESYREINFVLLALSSSLGFWELMVTGHDLIAVGFCFALLSLLTARLSIERQLDSKWFYVLAMAVGCFATSRIFFICFPILLAAFLWKFRKGMASRFLIVSLMTALGLHGYFYVTSDYYQPLHLLQRGSVSVGVYLSMFGFLLTLSAFALIYRKMANTVEDWLGGVFICLSIPLFVISLGELNSVGFDVARWEGANYLIPAVPLLLLLVARNIFKHEKRANSDEPALSQSYLA